MTKGGGRRRRRRRPRGAGKSELAGRGVGGASERELDVGRKQWSVTSRVTLLRQSEARDAASSPSVA